MASQSQFNLSGLSNAQNTRGGVAGDPAETNALSRQPSIYSLTFDEFQDTWGGLGKDFGSMNMDELLKSIWSAEESQAMTSNSGNGRDGGIQPENTIQRQGSLTLPRTLSQKRVEEVWQDLLKENTEKNCFIKVGFNAPQKQPTLGEITLEEFLVRAGVVREDPLPIERPSNVSNIDFPSVNNKSDLEFSFPSQSQSRSFLVSQVNNQFPNLSSNSKTSLQQPPLFSKPVTSTSFASNINSVSGYQIGLPSSRNTADAIDPLATNGIVHCNGLGNGGVSLLGLDTRGPVMPTGSPASQLSPDMLSRSSADGSPVPFPFGQGRKSNGSLEKVVERRQRRMIKNRESAARSRARKQAYTLELEAEVAKLKELNQELQKKQEELMNMQKNQVMEQVNRQWGGKRVCLRRTFTGPW
ncbi:hypothetical protein MLD38_023057 [Melastoma candidum]|uniref:Uncharacterized protein n=1 Tax=Melastoma candidum TaxID=119954 RepID=A0ACB9QLC1_9MYRT|nr:hypothetical protein MLD38_023057 [Melastoma candidum]